jgi:hypothetical protein
MCSFAAAALRSLARDPYADAVVEGEPGDDLPQGRPKRNSLILRNRDAWNRGAWDGRFFKGTDGLRKLAVRRRD